jgi:hypothetical protein
MVMWRVVALCGLLAVGCDDDASLPADLAASSDLSAATDLAPPKDLTPPPPVCMIPDGGTPASPVDAGAFCAGTPLDGTCVQAFFAKIAGCFQPAGCCALMASMHERVDWASGARYDHYIPEYSISYEQSGALCGQQMSSLGTPPPPGHWTAGDNSTLTVTPAIGLSNGPFDATCSDGTHVSFSAGDCADLDALLSPNLQGCVPTI